VDPRLLAFYNQELAHLREMGAEFAREYPKVAARLGMEGLEVADPYVERLLEGFAFIAARIQLKLDAEFPRFTQHLLELTYPHHLAPMPSFGICEFVPRAGEGSLASGPLVPRGTSLRSPIPRGEQTACEFRTAHALRLWPIEIAEVRSFTYAPDLPVDRVRTPEPVKGGLRIRLRCRGGLHFEQLECDALTFHVAAQDATAHRLHELVHGACVGAMLTDGAPRATLLHALPRGEVREVGHADEQALLPYTPRSLQAYRLLHEYFAFPQRYLFFEVTGLLPGLRRVASDECELVLLFGRADPALESSVDSSALAINATPIVNLFPRRADRVHLSEERFEHHLVVDRARPMDFEIHTVTSVRGIAAERERDVAFQPLYGTFEDAPDVGAYFTARREPRMLSSGQRQHGTRSGYVGSEVFLSLVDEREAPYPHALQQLAVEVLATNRDLPLLLPIGALGSLTPHDALPVEGVRLLRGPTRPRPAVSGGDVAWRLVNHLSLSHLSLIDAADGRGATALRELLSLYAEASDPANRQVVEAVRRVASRPLVRRLPVPGPIVFGRGVGVELTVDEAAFADGGAFLFGAVFEKFIARYVSINSFTQTSLTGEGRGRIGAWPARAGARTLG